MCVPDVEEKMLELKNIGVVIKDGNEETEILKDISLTVNDGELVVLTGPNGGGKTTLAKVIMGLVSPASGSIYYNGNDITGLDITSRARAGVCYGFQQPPRFKGLTVRDLLTIATGGGVLPKGDACRYLTQVGLCANDYLDREMDSSLSGGEIKRIEIATVLARAGAPGGIGLMIFDEPEAGIDLWSFSRLIETFGTLHADHTASMIIISHQERIIRIADRVAVISGGRVSQIGSAEEVFPSIIADTVDSCPVIGRREH